MWQVCNEVWKRYGMLTEKVLLSLTHCLVRGIFLHFSAFFSFKAFYLLSFTEFLFYLKRAPCLSAIWHRLSGTRFACVGAPQKCGLRFMAQTSASRPVAPPPSKAQFQGAFFRGILAGLCPVCPAWCGHQLHSELNELPVLP